MKNVRNRNDSKQTDFIKRLINVKSQNKLNEPSNEINVF